MRFHIPGLAHTVTHPDYTSCAFTQKILKLCVMLSSHGHKVYHYGNGPGDVFAMGAVEHWNVGDPPEHDWRKLGFPDYNSVDWRAFNAKVSQYIGETKQPGDFILFSFGDCQKSIMDDHKDLIAVEAGIGYPGAHFAPYKVFESYAILNAYKGLAAVGDMNGGNHWLDTVIPNYFDPKAFYSRIKKEDYLLFLGRAGQGKGLHIAQDLAQRTGHKLVMAGQGTDSYPDGLGVVGPAQRRKLLSRAKAVICASTYAEPFCGVMVEAFLSATPVISSDFGAFAEYNIHGLTGYRCRTMGEFVWAVENLAAIRPEHCWEHGRRFTMDAVYPMYERYFEMLAAGHREMGWYEPISSPWSLAPQGL